MRRMLKAGFASVAGLMTLIASLLLSAVTGVDRRPAPDAPWHRATLHRLGVLTNTPIGDPGELEAGFARVDWTPRIVAKGTADEPGEFDALPLAGYGARQGRSATGTHEPLWIKAVALRRGSERVVLVAADALIIPAEVAEEAARRLNASSGLRREDLYFGATHTHGGPGGWGQGPVAELFAGAHDPRATEWFVQSLEQAARTAWQDLRKAEVGHGRFDAPDLVRNRLVGDSGRVDPRFELLVVRRDDGSQAIVGSYAAHATVLGAGVMEWHGDYPGAWQRAVESETGSMAVFFAGGVGSHSPRAPEHGFPGAESLGKELGKRTIEALRSTRFTARTPLRLATLEVDLPELEVRISQGLRLRPFLADALLPVNGRTRLQALRIGEAVWFSTPCDFSGELTLELREALEAPGIHVHATSFNGDYLGYVIPSRYGDMEGYEPRTMCFYGPILSDYFMQLLGPLGRHLSATP